MTKNTVYQLQENIVFKGEHVLSELRTLSFEPSVSITEHADQVVVEGTLHLAGEGSYVTAEGTRDYEYPEVQESTVMEELVFFEHHFPLSISISSARVERKQDVEVYIDHVDYELPEPGVLQVTADIMIEGISEPKREEVRMLPNQPEEWSGEGLTELLTEEPQEAEPEEPAVTEEETQEDITEPPIEQETVEAREEPAAQEEAVQEETEQREEQEEETDEEDEEYKKRDEDTFARFIQTLEENRTIIKIHIAQQDETPEMVAERYGVPMLQLMKSNQFESRRPFNRGELIWIPSPQIHSK
ncbi:hypothetical protein KP77_02910 [Jeotgalibacillus alimentarius]|uniref:Stage VI sporulation protein D N-terminal domain-containing protein n=1 Tax=Jeotgalibacillus alimentarius TaxID=135826 RepID=A0A0C2RSV7_9BACL|nr:hypothetical protein [Jeotgalibacillus alimentarius]KIL53315.1 hypothetical protein KP77_02910 [Jeotgalibacillus alimentarius]